MFHHGIDPWSWHQCLRQIRVENSTAEGKNLYFETMIHLRNIDFIRAGKKLYENFSWIIETNENWIITGPNGSGKTFLLEMLSGNAHVPKGEISYDFVKGKTWDERFAEKRRMITYIPTHALHAFLHGPDLYYQQRYYGIGDEHGLTVKDVLGENIMKLKEFDIPSSSSIEHLMDVEVTHLSNGQLKKLLMLKSFVKGMPKLLLMDYPFEGLDYESRKNLCEFIDFIATRHGVQVVMVDHQNDIPTCINRRLTVEQFKIVRSETLDGEDESITTNAQSESSQGNPITSGQEVIRIKNLLLKHGDHEIFKGFNWRVNKGERWALTGRNGSGKTTLFSLIFADHPQAYAQEIYLFGRRRGSGESIWDIKKKINYLGPEQISFLNAKGIFRTALQYIKSVNTKFSDAVFQQLVSHFQAQSFIDKPVSALSSGELQLLIILNCFLSEKELWLLDEPFQFLDPDQKDRLTRYLLTHLSREITLILITHNDADLATWTDKRMQI